MASASPIAAIQPPPPPSTSATTPTMGTMTPSPRIARSPLVSNNPGSSLNNRSSAQLASLLAETLRENELLKRELSVSKRSAEKYERMVTLVSPSTTSTPSSPESLPPAAVKRILDYEAKLERLERAEVERDEYQARIRIMQDIWGQLDHYLAQCEFRAKDAREGFNKIFQDAGGQLQPMTKEQWNIHLPDIPFPNTVPFPSPTYLPSERQPTANRSITSRPHHRQAPPPPHTPGSLQLAPTMLINASGNNGTSLPSFSLPPHPGGTSRTRPRAESMDTATYSSGPPPAKKARADGVYRDDTRRFSRSPITQNALPAHHVRHSSSSSSAQPGALHAHQQIRDEHSRRHRHQNESGSPAVRGRSPRRPSSRSSSTSLDEMLLEATSTNHDGQQPPQPNMFTYPQPQPNQAGPPHQRSPSPNSHSPVNSRGVMFSGQNQGGGLHSYQTHIFAPPVTGAPPVKKSNTSTSLTAGLSRGASLAGNPSHPGHHGAHVLGPGGYPPTNAQGQRICRQCGLVGRYKDGKCVEKWGPGPEGPGTVCDKCRKKMKRVERRGTIESQQQREQREQHQQVQQALAHHRSQQQIQASGPPSAPGTNENNLAAERTSSSTSGSSVRRTDTVVVGPGMSYDNSRIPTPARPEDSRPSPLSGPSHTRSDTVRRADTHASPSANGNGVSSSRRTVPTPPYIATLPGSNENDEEDERELERREREHERTAPTLSNGTHAGRDSGTPNGISAKPDTGVEAPGPGTVDAQMDVDRDVDDGDGDGDADGEEDAEADLLEAVDAAEEAHALSKDRSSGGSSRGDEEDQDELIKMKIEEEI